MATPIIAEKPPANGASPIVQFCQPACSPPFRMPTIISTPTAMKIITVLTLISANQYSASPNPFTEM